MRLRDLLPAGVPQVIGSYEFTADRIIAFAEQFDPHDFHLDAEKAKGSLFGGLCASGWHVCSAAMKCNVAHLQAEADRISAEGGIPPQIGPSPGVRNLKWLRPVFAGDVITYTMAFNHDTPVPGRPGRYLCDLSYAGTNQNGEMVMQFDCAVVEFD